jgi:hypothetical protein
VGSGLAAAGLTKQAQLATTVLGSWRTGKFTERAMKQGSSTPSCNRWAMSASAPAAIVTCGRRTTSVKLPDPSGC